MSSDKKWREFWVERGSFVWVCVTNKDDLSGWTREGSPYHVIEYAALKEKDEEIERLRERIKELEGR